MTDPTSAPPGAGAPSGPAPRTSRRSLLTGALGVAAGAGLGVAGTALFRTTEQPTAPIGPAAVSAAVVPAEGVHQAGITRPGTPQRHTLVAVYDLDGTDLAFLPTLGARIRELTGGADPLLPDGPAALTVTVGLGPRPVAAAGRTVGAQDLPEFRGDDAIPADHRGGDLLLSLCADDPVLLAVVRDELAAGVPGARLRWQQFGHRGPGEGTIVRNPLGFHDGVIVPHTEQDLAENVWLTGDLTGGSICVIRRLTLDDTAFRALPVGEQEAVIGRRRTDGSPLSGGGPTDEANLGLKSPDGQYLVPARSHVRAAHPSFTGSALMLRRGYAYTGERESGLLFICFQRDLRTFVATQHRLDEVDDLMGYVRPTASATFLILPGFTAKRPLGVDIAR